MYKSPSIDFLVSFAEEILQEAISESRGKAMPSLNMVMASPEIGFFASLRAGLSSETEPVFIAAAFLGGNSCADWPNPPLNNLYSIREWGNAAFAAGMREVACTAEPVILSYRNSPDCLEDLRQIRVIQPDFQCDHLPLEATLEIIKVSGYLAP